LNDGHTPAPVDISGASMDVIVPRRRRAPRLIIASVTGTLLVALAVWALMPSGLSVPRDSVRIATVTQDVFRDDVMVRAVAEPLHSVVLDSVESGRVEEVISHDGAIVRKGDLLFRLSNPQRNVDLLKSQSDEAQQVSNMLTLRLALQSSQSDHLRRIADAEYQLSQAEILYKRKKVLATKGFVSQTELEQSELDVRHDAHLLSVEQESGASEIKIRKDAVEQMERAIQRLQSGLELVQANVDALGVRAPIAGRLTDFRLQVGEAVKQDQHIGRIDDPQQFQLAASIDEFYSDRTAVGRPGLVTVQNQKFPVKVSRVYSEIKEGRFAVELVFTGAQPESLTPGQGVNLEIALGESSAAVVLPNGPFFTDTRGSWVFVLRKNDSAAERRAIRIGRSSAAQIEVLSGLKPGERVIISSYSPYGNETRLRLQ